MVVNRAVSSHPGRVGLTLSLRCGRGDHAARPHDLAGEIRRGSPLGAGVRTPSLSCRCNIGEMSRKVPVKCAIAGCYRRLKMTLPEREELRRVGRENNATAGLVCPVHVKAAFDFEFDDIDIDVPLEELLVEASRETPRWRMMLTPFPGSAAEPDSNSMTGRGDRVV